MFFLNKNDGVFPELPKNIESVLRRFDFCYFFFRSILNILKNLVSSDGC
jgi:hypothetical protein